MKLQGSKFHRRAAILAVDFTIAMAMVVLVVAPISHSWLNEQRVIRNYYYRAVAIQIVDGEMEILAAGAGSNAADGSTEYQTTAQAAENLPPGKFHLERSGKKLTLSWRPEKRSHGSEVKREATLP